MVAVRTLPTAPAVDPARDRMPFHKKLVLLAELGYWPGLDRIYRTAGPSSPEAAAYIDEHLPKAHCAHCDAWYYDYSRRVKYCSEHCRREAAKGEPRPPRVTATPPPLTSHVVRLWRAGSKGQTRTYELRLLPSLLGGATLHCRWSITGCQGWTQRYEDVTDAEAAFRRYWDEALKRGYREEEQA